MANLQFVECNDTIEPYPTWDQLPGSTVREWAIFFGQNITAGEMVAPPLSILSEIPEHIPDGVPAVFQADCRACPDVRSLQRCRRLHCDCVDPDFIDFSRVLLNSPCWNFFRGLCTRDYCENVHGNTFAEAVYASYLQHTNQRPRIILNYIQAAGKFEVVTKQSGTYMLLSSMSAGDIMAAKSFVFGRNWTQRKTSDAYSPQEERDPWNDHGGDPVIEIYT